MASQGGVRREGFPAAPSPPRLATHNAQLGTPTPAASCWPSSISRARRLPLPTDSRYRQALPTSTMSHTLTLVDPTSHPLYAARHDEPGSEKPVGRNSPGRAGAEEFVDISRPCHTICGHLTTTASASTPTSSTSTACRHLRKIANASRWGCCFGAHRVRADDAVESSWPPGYPPSHPLSSLRAIVASCSFQTSFLRRKG